MGQQDDNVAFTSIVSQAQRGDALSMTRLAEGAEKRLYAYIYRLTLNADLTEELLQQTLLKMVESLGQLRDPEHFWPWLLRTALSQVQHHFRAERQRSQVVMSARHRERCEDRQAARQDDGLTFASRRELTGIIFEAMSRIKLSYRNVVVLRCLEGMSYEEIADVLDCKELHARVLFFRGRSALRRQLSRRGYREGLLLTALGLFKLATSQAKGAAAAGTINAASLDVGLLAVVVGSVGTRIGIAGVALFGFLAALTALEFLLCVAALLGFLVVYSMVTLYIELS